MTTSRDEADDAIILYTLSFRILSNVIDDQNGNPNSSRKKKSML